LLRVGLTGGVASGKSTVARLLRGRGAATLDADAVVEELYRPGAPGACAVAALFGPGALDAAGGVERAALGALVLADAAARARLEAAVHPLVRARIAAWLASLAGAASAPRVAVVEAALLVETGSFRDYHRLVVVGAPLELRRARALRAGWPAARFDRTAAAQADDASRERAADYLVRNEGRYADLEAATGSLWPLLLEDAAAVAAGLPLPARGAG